MTDTIPGAITRFCNMLVQINITEIDEDDPHYVLYSVRVPSEARLFEAVTHRDCAIESAAASSSRSLVEGALCRRSSEDVPFGAE